MKMIAWIVGRFRLRLAFKRAERDALDNDKKQISDELHEIAVRVHTMEWQADVKRRDGGPKR